MKLLQVIHKKKKKEMEQFSLCSCLFKKMYLTSFILGVQGISSGGLCHYMCQKDEATQPLLSGIAMLEL